MINNYRHLFALFMLIISLKLCHPINHNRINTFMINSNTTDSIKALQIFSKSFSGESFKEFSLFSLISHNGKTSLFVVCRNDTVLQIAMESMTLDHIYRADTCSTSQNSECEEPVIVNLLSGIDLLKQNMMFFCYLFPDNRIASTSLTSCIVPKNNVLPQELRWTKKGFTSTSNQYRTFVIQTKSSIFIGSYVQKSLSILRTKLPDIFGLIDSSHDLVTPRAEFYFEKNSNFLEGFATEYEVYFVIQEPISAKSHSLSECLSSSDTSTVISTRLIRICKDDPGVRNYDEHNFGTAAKADIVCPVGGGKDQYYYTRSISASWSGDKLYILFESQKNAPRGKVLCVYDEFAFKVAFNSGMVPPIIFHNMDKHNVKVDNPFKDICKKITEKSLTETQQTEAASISANGLYRLRNILPIRTVPLLELRNLSYHSISTFRLSKLDQTTIIALMSDNVIKLVSHSEEYGICQLKNFKFPNNETINQVKGDNILSKVYIHISTNKRMVQIELTMCATFPEKLSCLNEAPNICGWDFRQSKCTLLTDEIDSSRWQRSSCMSIVNDNAWSWPEKCSITNDQQILSCSCKYCLVEEGCADGRRVEIVNCSSAPNINSYHRWSPWSKCNTTTQLQKRTRECNFGKCLGASSDYRKCPQLSSSVEITSWTKWYKTDNSKYLISFRAKCPTNPLLPPTIEEKMKFCGESCQDNSLKWSTWSECLEINIQYRLLNCSSFDMCPPERTEAKVCTAPSRKYLQQAGHVDGSYSIIHIVLAVLVVSLVWLIILGVVSVYLFRYSLKNPRLANIGISRPTYDRSLFPGSSLTSNDYMIPVISSPLFPHQHNTFSSSPSDLATSSNRNLYTALPLITDDHSNMFINDH